MDDIVIFLKLLILLYADDTVLVTLLIFFSDYCNEWKLRINVEKTKA